MLDLAASFIVFTTFITYLNYRFTRLPPTIGIMATALLFSAIAIGLSELGYPILHEESRELLRRIDFSSVLMTWFLPALLFAGALHVDLRDLHSYKWPIGLLATAGVLVSTLAVALLAYYSFGLFGWQVDFIYCLLFGALISPPTPSRCWASSSRPGRRSRWRPPSSASRCSTTARRWWCSPSC